MVLAMAIGDGTSAMTTEMMILVQGLSFLAKRKVGLVEVYSRDRTQRSVLAPWKLS